MYGLADSTRRLMRSTKRSAMSKSCNAMTEIAERRLLFVDIDGVLNPYHGPCPDGFSEYWLFTDEDEPVRVSDRHGEWLHELARHYDLMWGSSWSEEERAMLAGILDLPYFHGAVELPRGQFDPALKVPAIDRAAGVRSLAWIEDLLTREAWTWSLSRAAPTLLVLIDPAVGLTHEHVVRLIDWAAEIR
jgi:hypothetical protein